jgi:hypothetical protein
MPTPDPRNPADARPSIPRPSPVAKQRPDPRPMRLGLAAGGFAALSVMVAGLVRFPVADPTAVADDVTDPAVTTAQQVRVEKQVRYVQLKPGEKAPRGARVIDAAAPTPRVVVTRVVAQAAVRRVAKTRQSGR